MNEERDEGRIKLSDFRPKNLHPKAKFRICMALLGTFLLIFGCICMLSTATITFGWDFSTTAGFSASMRNLIAIGYVIGTIIVILILWYVMIKDCPISPNAKKNYDAAHDKTEAGVKVITAIAAAVVNKGGGNSLENVADAVDNYFEETQDNQEQPQQQ